MSKENILEGISFLRIPARILNEVPAMCKGEIICTFFLLKKMLNYSQVHYQVGLSTIATQTGVSLGALKAGKKSMLRRGFITLTRKGQRGRGNMYGLNHELLATVAQEKLNPEENKTKELALKKLTEWIEKHVKDSSYLQQIKNHIARDRSPSVLKMYEYVRAIQYISYTKGTQKIREPAKFFYSMMIKNAEIPVDYLAAKKSEKEKVIKQTANKKSEERRAQHAQEMAEEQAKMLPENEKSALLDYSQWWQTQRKREGRKTPSSEVLAKKIKNLKKKYGIKELPDISLVKYLEQDAQAI